MVTADEARRELARRELARRRGQVPQAAPEQPDTVGDMFSSFAAGAGRGAADLAGLPGTLSDLGQGALQWGLQKGYGLATGQAPDPSSESAVERFFAGPTPELQESLAFGGQNPLSGNTLRGGLSNVTGGATDYQPQTTAGEYARTVGEFLPGAMTLGGGGVANALRYGVIPALTSETAGQVTEDTAVEPYARIAGALLGGYAGNRIGRPSAQKPPTAAEIKKSAGYGDQMTQTLRSAKTTDQTYQGIVRDLWDDVKQAGTSYEVQQNFGRTMQNELKLVQQEGASLHSLERLRQALRSAGGGTLDTPNQAIANRLIEKLDAAVDGLSASNIASTGQTGRPVLDVLREAREVYRVGSKSQIIEKAIRNGMDAKSGVENGLRQEFTRLLKNDKAMRGFSKVEQDAIRLAAKGDFRSLALRWFGTFGIPVDQGRNFLGSVAGGGIGSAVGGPVGAMALPLAGTAAKVGASRMAQNQAAIAEALVKAGPSGQGAFSAAREAHQVAGREALIRALLQSQSAIQVPSRQEYAR